VQYELELTPKLRRQRAIRVALDVPQELVAQAALRLLRLAFDVQEGALVQLGCTARLVSLAATDEVPTPSQWINCRRIQP
jgi:hypothetical protein